MKLLEECILQQVFKLRDDLGFQVIACADDVLLLASIVRHLSLACCVQPCFDVDSWGLLVDDSRRLLGVPSGMATVAAFPPPSPTRLCWRGLNCSTAWCHLVCGKGAMFAALVGQFRVICWRVSSAVCHLGNLVACLETALSSA